MYASHRLRSAASVAAILLSSFISLPAGATADVVIRGIVYDEMSAPLPGAHVLLHDARGQPVADKTTGADGSYSFAGISFGDYTVEASAPGKADAHQHVQVASSDVAEVDLYCVAMTNSYKIVEHDEVPLPSRATGSVSTMNRRSLQALPQGDDRPITDVLTTQPGFVLDAFGNVYARGNHANVQYQIDGVPIPDSVGNLFASALPVRLIQNLDIITGGVPAEFGDRLAAVVNIATRRGGAAPEGQVQLRYGSFQTVEPSAWYSRSFGRLGVFVGGSYSQSERALDSPAVTPILHDDGKTGRAFFRLDWLNSDHDRFELFGSYSYNHFQIPIDPTVVPLDPTQPGLVRPPDQYGNA
ncbi:MAG TPA: TonB-dependent receptor, partial [Polyangia bacterium]|nr:TonB-dependent receptor [Polyangia bacterium]